MFHSDIITCFSINVRYVSRRAHKTIIVIQSFNQSRRADSLTTDCTSSTEATIWSLSIGSNGGGVGLVDVSRCLMNGNINKCNRHGHRQFLQSAVQITETNLLDCARLLILASTLSVVTLCRLSCSPSQKTHNLTSRPEVSRFSSCPRFLEYSMYLFIDSSATSSHRSYYSNSYIICGTLYYFK